MKYSISALSRKTGLSIHTLRYYEKEGLLRYVERTESGRRVYGEASMGCLLGVLCMKQAGMTLPQIKAFMDVTIEGVATLPRRLEMMLSAREQLSKLKEAVDRGLQLADFFIGGCRNAMEAMKNGADPEEAFPYITRDGIVDFPFLFTEDGRLEPAAPPAEFNAAEEKKKVRKTPTTNKKKI
ncbi:MAG: MerR family transcriptional regulator [Akkermansia sp.]|nr:MerR family transcriptional regulator [Akkermansia sp.]MBQ8375482.1 MerR family transcriptional regulator [Akkermansia sp.]